MIRHRCKENEPLLSGYLDGELTAGDRQRVELILDECETCSRYFKEINQLRRQVGGISYDKMTVTEKDEINKAVDGSVGAKVGQLLLLGGVIIVYGTGIVYLLRGLIMSDEAPWFVRVGVPTILVGVGILFFTVLFQRIQAAKTDKYKNVRL